MRIAIDIDSTLHHYWDKLSDSALRRFGIDLPYDEQFDWGITPNMEGPKGAFAVSPAPKAYARLRGGVHVEWTDLACLGVSSVAACLKARPNVVAIDRYLAAFLDRYLKDDPVPLLALDGSGLSAYRLIGR